MSSKLLNYAARAVTRLAIKLDPEQRQAFLKLREINAAKEDIFALKKATRAAHGRRRSRQTKKIKAGRIRSKFEPLQIFAPSQEQVETKEYVPHAGVNVVGDWQIKFLKEQGLAPNHKFLDIGCGDLKAGVPLIRYLDADNYVGMDQNPGVINLGSLSLDEAAWAKCPTFYVGGDFGVEAIDTDFDFAWAHSVFTHVDISMCGKCMASAYESLAPGGLFMATFFLAPDTRPWLTESQYRAGNERSPESEKHTYAYRNPFHHPKELMLAVARGVGYDARVLEPDHPKRQSVLFMRKPSTPAS